MKSILMSIKPKWVEKIASGEKTVEVRKTAPKLETPFKCYIYETLDGGHSCKRCKETSETCYSWAKSGVGCYNGRGKVVGEFVCDLALYFGGNDGYGLHISDLKIYDKPRELSDFRVKNKIDIGWDVKTVPLFRPPQSWCYVEEL